jgi:5-hydroxyisourate hydrolase
LGRLTTHVLNTAEGIPASGITISLLRNGQLLHETKTNADGRCDTPPLEGEAFTAGSYTLAFHAADYFRGRGVALSNPPFLDIIDLAIGLTGDGIFHVPLLVSPWAYSTYRGS